MKDRRLNTSSPFWKTTSQPQSRSTSQGTTSRKGRVRVGWVRGASHRGTSVKIKKAQDNRELHKWVGRLDGAAEKDVFYATNWSTTTLLYLQVQVALCPLCPQGPKGLEMQTGALSSGNPANQKKFKCTGLNTVIMKIFLLI